MADLIASWIVKGLNRFLHLMPISFTVWLGGRVGSFIYLVSGKRRRVTYSNLKAAFAGRKAPREIKHISKEVYRNVGRVFAELLALTKVDQQYIDKYVDVKNLERLHKAGSNPKGMILVSAHFGNWELSTVTSVFLGFPLYLLARDQKMEKLNELLNLLRESKGNIVVRKGMDIKKIFHMLREGKSIGILADQNAGPSGELVDLFGRPASTVVGPYRIAQKTGASLLPAFIHRKKGPYHEVILEDIMDIDKDADVISYIEKYNDLLEKHVTDHPGQWFWMHKRWKMTPLKKIMVLDDGKRGHFKQSMSVVEQIERYRKDEGFSPDDLEVEKVDIRYKNRFFRTVLNMCAPFVNDWFQMHLFLLRFALKKDCYEDIVNRYSDVVISCGSSLVAVNRLLKLENMSRNVAVLDPGIFYRNSFDLIVVPEHDASGALKKRDNVVVTALAPNLISPDGLKSFSDDLKGKDEDSRDVGVLIGGDNSYYVFSDTLADNLTDSLQSASEALGCGLRITTSRRTPDSVERILEGGLKKLPSCRCFVLGRDDKDEHTVEKIMASSSVIVVSGESISMVSEAVASGKPVVVFMPEPVSSQRNKYGKFVEYLESKGYVTKAAVKDVAVELERILASGVGNILPDDDDRVYKKLYKLF